MKKYIFIILLLGVVKLCNIDFLTKDLNIANLVSQFASNLYEYDNPVSQQGINVINYDIDDNGVWIIPTKNEVILPISGIIGETGANYIDIQTSCSTYRIYGVDSKYYLYQYYKEGSILGQSSMYYIQTEDIASIVSYLTISYETV